MRNFVILLILSGLTQVLWSQPAVRIKLKDYQTVKGKWMGMGHGQYLVRQDDGVIIHVPEEMVLRMKIKRSFEDYPRYDMNRNTFIYGWTGDINSTIGQDNHNLRGVGINFHVGYDWNHNYSLSLATGYRNMNIGREETFVAVTLTAKKYLTHGRYLLFTGIEAGYQWGIDNQWHSPEPLPLWSSRFRPFSWQITPHKQGSGPSVTPLIGVRKIGQYGFDHVISVGLHFQKFHSGQLQDDADLSEIDILYRRWRIGYGMIF